MVAVLTFVRERFPVVVSVPLALAVAGGARPSEPWGELLRLSSVCWCYLLGARVLDDLADLKLDRLRKPSRGLASGRIDSRRLASAGVLVWLLSLAALAPSGLVCVLTLLAASLVSLGYYVVREQLAPVLRPFWLNAPYLALTLLSPIAHRAVGPTELSLALFVWLAVVGHDFAHSIEADDQSQQPSGLSARAHGRLGLGFCSAALLAAAGFALLTRDPLFALALAILGPWLVVLLVRLVRQPSSKRAAGLYVPGGLLFILPLLGRLSGRFIG